MTTPTLHQAAQVALDALEPLSAYGRVGTRDVDQAALQQVCAALREALAQPVPEPVARVAEVHMSRYTIEWTNGPLPEGTGLYAAPPAAPAPAGWVMVPRGLLRRLIAGALRFDPILQDNEAIEQAKQLAASPAAPAAPVVPAVPLSCNKVPPGNGYCDHCARGEYEKCRYTTPAAPVVPLTDGQIRQIVRDTFDVVPLPHDITFARAIEAAHGITGGKP